MQSYVLALLNLQTAALRSHLELAVGGEDADPSVVIVGHHDVAVHVHGDAGGSLQLARRATSDPEAHLELAVVGEHLQSVPSERESYFGVIGGGAAPLHWDRDVHPHLYALVVAVGDHHSAVAGGRDSLKVCELPFFSAAGT